MKKKLNEAKKTTLEIAKEVGITLKKVRTFNHRRGTAIEADVYLNGKLLAHASDEGIGGMMHIEATFKKDDFDEMRANRKIIQEVEEAIAKYPEVDLDYYGRISKIKNDLEYVINALIDAKEAEKVFNRDKKKGILVDGSIIHWNSGSLPNMIKKFGKERTLEVVQKKCDALVAEKTEILNKDYLKSIGIKF